SVAWSNRGNQVSGTLISRSSDRWTYNKRLALKKTCVASTVNPLTLYHKFLGLKSHLEHPYLHYIDVSKNIGLVLSFDTFLGDHRRVATIPCGGRRATTTTTRDGRYAGRDFPKRSRVSALASLQKLLD